MFITFCQSKYILKKNIHIWSPLLKASFTEIILFGNLGLSLKEFNLWAVNSLPWIVCACVCVCVRERETTVSVSSREQIMAYFIDKYLTKGLQMRTAWWDIPQELHRFKTLPLCYRKAIFGSRYKRNRAFLCQKFSKVLARIGFCLSTVSSIRVGSLQIVF